MDGARYRRAVRRGRVRALPALRGGGSAARLAGDVLTRLGGALDRVADRAADHPRNPLRLPERPPIPADSRRDAAFDELIEEGGELAYALPYPKWQLLARAVERHRALLHGSNRTDVSRFEPRAQTSYEGVPTTAVFATPDPIWPIFFAVLDKDRANSFWNQCLLPESSGLERTRYFFSVGGDVDASWTEGAVYLLPGATFRVSDAPAEWVSAEPVAPLARLRVSRGDFPFADRVFRHRFPAPLWQNVARLAWNGLRPRRP